MTTPTIEVAAYRTFCPICGSIMSHIEWEGMMGWMCPDPDCEFFMPDA